MIVKVIIYNNKLTDELHVTMIQLFFYKIIATSMDVFTKILQNLYGNTSHQTYLVKKFPKQNMNCLIFLQLDYRRPHIKDPSKTAGTLYNSSRLYTEILTNSITYGQHFVL